MASDNLQLARQTKAVLATLALLGPLEPLPQDMGPVSSLLLGSSVVLCSARGKALLSSQAGMAPGWGDLAKSQVWSKIYVLMVSSRSGV